MPFGTKTSKIVAKNNKKTSKKSKKLLNLLENCVIISL